MSGITTKVPLRFTPASYDGREKAPVYLIGAASLRQRAQFRSALTAIGARLPAQSELFAAIRQGIIDLVAEDEQAKALELVDAQETKQELGAEDNARWTLLLDGLRHAPYRPLTELEAGQQYWMEMVPLIAANMFLIGWENVAQPFTRKNGALSEGYLESVLPGEDVIAIGWEALARMRATPADEKNSASPPPSSANL